MPVRNNENVGKKIFTNIIKYLFVTANIIAALLLIIAAYSDRIPPDKSMIFSYLGLAFPYFCLLNIVFIVYWMFLKEWRFLLIGAITLIICWQPVRSYFPLHFRTDPLPTENVIKVLTYNVMGFGYKDHTEESPNEIIQFIAESNADIVCMQEYFVSRAKNKISKEKLNKALSMYPYHSVIQLQGKSWGIAVYSKFPISKSRKIKYDSNNNGSSIHEIDINGKTLTLINNHLESFKLTMEDKSRYADFIKGIGSDTFEGLKGTIQQKLGPAFRIRAEQARAIAEEIKSIRTDYTLVCGDFNDTPISYAHHTIKGPLLDAFAESGRGLGVTYNQNFFWFRIDHILHSSNMQSMNCTVGKVKYSDHYPMWCYLKLN